MNVTVNDIKEIVLTMEKKIDSINETVMKEIFEEYDKVDEIKKVLSNLENFVDGRYEFDECGDLVYGVKIPDHIVDLPFINDYLTQDYAHISKDMGSHNEIWITQTCGECIAVNYSHSKNCSFIYDQNNTRKVVIEKNLEWMDSKYITAKLEEYQTVAGCFGDIVVIDNYYGSYCKHFESDKEVNESNYKEIVKQYEDKYLNNEDEF